MKKKQQHINSLEWPRQLLELNPIKNLWENMKNQFGKYQLSNLAALKKVYYEKWLKKTVNCCLKFVYSYKKYIQ